MMGGGVSCVDEQHITFDDKKTKRITFDDVVGVVVVVVVVRRRTN